MDKYELIKAIRVVPENLEHIAKTGKINGSLLLSILNVLEIYGAFKYQQGHTDGVQFVRTGCISPGLEIVKQRLAYERIEKGIVKDLTDGEDCRGDHAFFIDISHFDQEGKLDDEAKAVLGSRLTMFRIIDQGVQDHRHGWIEDGEVIQWG